MYRINGMRIEKNKRFFQNKDLNIKKKAPSTVYSDNGTVELSDSISITESTSIESPVFARLQPLDLRVDPIELFAHVALFGRTKITANGQQYYDFSRLITVGGDVSCLISRQQFRIERDKKNEKTYLVDTSRNGTFINQFRHPIGERVQLNHADVISMGRPDLYFWIYDERRFMNLPEKLAKKYVVSNMELGRGGYSKVLLAKVRGCISKRVAIKILNRHNPSQSRHCAEAEDIKREVEVMCSIKHPFCMGYLDYYEDDLRSFIVVEFAAGGDLFTKITASLDSDGQCTGLKEDVAKLYTYQVMKALEYLHDRGITHRDIKPENILLVDKVETTLVKLCDFGLAKILYQASTMNSYVGTPSYIAPEVRDTAEAYTSAIDIWSMGVVLFMMLSGYPPFCESYDDMDLEKQIRTGRLLFSHKWKRVGVDAQMLVRKMLTVNYSLRITATDALKHSWFDEKAKEQTENLLVKNKENEI